MATSNINTKKLKVTELDFDLIKESFKDFLRGYSSEGVGFTDYDFEGSGLSALIDVLAYNTHYNAFYTNMIANEMFLDTATLRNSVVSISKQLGYTPRSVVGAKATITLDFEAPDLVSSGQATGSEVPIPKGSIFTSVVEDKTYAFATTKSYTAIITSALDVTPPIYQATNVEIVEGLYSSVQYAYNSQVQQNFIIPNKNVDTSTISIIVTDVVSGTSRTIYRLAKDYAALSGTSAVFFLQETSDELYEIYFGDGNVGRKPSDGNVIDISYIVSNGPGSNGAWNFKSNVINSPKVDSSTSYSPTITTQMNAFAGADRESIDSIKFLAPRNYEAQNRAVTIDDYKIRIVTDFPQVDAVTCWGGEDNNPPDYGKVYISIKPKTGYVLSDTEKLNIKENILRPRNVVTIEPILIDPDYLYLVLDSRIKWDSRYTSLTSATLKAGLIREIATWAQENVERFETYFRHSALTRTIDNYDQGIMNNLTKIKIKKEITPTIGVVNKYTIPFSNPLYRTGHQSSLTSTTFQYLGYTSCMLSDVEGVIQIKGESHTGQNVLVDDSVGTINYDNGLLILNNFAPEIVDNSGVLSIIIIPEVNDVVPKLNQLVTLKDSDITVTMSDDSSVLEGTLYTTGTSGITTGSTGTGTSGY